MAVLYLQQLLTGIPVPGQAAGMCTWWPDRSSLKGLFEHPQFRSGSTEPQLELA